MKTLILLRRNFLKSLGSVTAVATLAKFSPLSVNSELISPEHENKAIGLIGLGRQGAFLAKRFPELVNVTAVCDVHQGRLGPAIQRIPNVGVRAFRDYRELLALPELDGVAVATPDHWHALMTIEALAAGKHVYLEPPVCRSLAECRAMLKAERSSRKVVQVAIMGRANAATAAMRRFVQNGRLGQIGSVELWSLPSPKTIPCEQDEVAPGDLDWPMWLGPARRTSYCEDIFSGGWRHVPELGGGLYRERISTQFALLPWMAGIEVSGRWNVRPVMSEEGTPSWEPESLIFEPAASGISILWQQSDDGQHAAGWGTNLIGTKDSVWFAGGDASCAAETKVFAGNGHPAKQANFHPNHRGNWQEAIKGNQTVTMPLKTAVNGLALAIAGQMAWRLQRSVSMDLDSLSLGDEEATQSEAVSYREPWTLPE